MEIIIPAYNVEKYLERCLDSVVNQKTSYSFHVTCIDDGSTDSTGVIADKYAKFDNVTVIHHKNRGLSCARNAGLEISNGKYIIFVDSDDFIHEDFVQNLLGCAFSNDADLVQGNIAHCWENGKVRRLRKNKCGRISLGDLDGFVCGHVKKNVRKTVNIR